MSVATRPRSMTAHSSSHPAPIPTSSSTSTATISTNQSPHPRFNNFRPARYQTKEELDRFFGTTTVQKREQLLRVREADGQVYFDWIEKDEWQHLLATGSLTSPNSPAEAARRRSSAATFLTLNSPLCPASPARRASLASPGTSGSLSPLTGRFGEVRIGGESTDTEEGTQRRGRKRSNSALVGRNGWVDDQLPLSAGEEPSWVTAPGFKRRQSDGLVFHSQHSSVNEHDDEQEKGNTHIDTARIRISRLPLGHRKLDQETLDQAFGVHNPLLDLSPNATTLHPFARSHKPPTLHIPTNAQSSVEIDDAASPTCSSPRSPNTDIGGSTFDGTSGARRGTFGSLLPPLQPVIVQVLSVASRRVRHQSDSATTPPSSAAMEYLNSPAPSVSCKPSRALRHAASFDTPRQATFVHHDDTTSDAHIPTQPWAQRQRWHSAGDEQKIRAVRSVASLRSASNAAFHDFSPPVPHASAIGRGRKVSNSSEGSSASEACFTPLAPRTGAKKFDRTRVLHLNSLPSACASPSSSPASTISRLPPVDHVAPMRDPIIAHQPRRSLHLAVDAHQHTASRTSPKMGSNSGLRTGPEVYDGVDIPCASIYLYSDPEDNVEPALALTLSASKLKKLKKKSHSTSGANASSSAAHAEAPAHHARCASASSASIAGVAGDAGHAKGSSRWWSHILPN